MKDGAGSEVWSQCKNIQFNDNLCFIYMYIYLPIYLSDKQDYDYLYLSEPLSYDLSFLLMQSSFPKSLNVFWIPQDVINQFLNAKFSFLNLKRR